MLFAKSLSERNFTGLTPIKVKSGPIIPCPLHRPDEVARRPEERRAHLVIPWAIVTPAMNACIWVGSLQSSVVGATPEQMMAKSVSAFAVLTLTVPCSHTVSSRFRGSVGSEGRTKVDQSRR